jgi:site-specific recombinase XerD
MDLVAHYLIAARADGRSPKTIAWHQASLKQCDSWRDEHGIPGDPESWTPSVLRANVIYQQDRTNVRTGQPLSGSHINGLIRSVKVFCRWLRREELVHRDLFAKIRVPKPPILVVPTLSQPEIKQLLAAIRAGRQPKRDEALFLFMLEPSVRASELCGIDFEDLSFEWGIARVMD